MTVRWKPLLVLSGVFATIAVVGLIAMAYTLAPGGPNEMIAKARAERLAKRHGEAEIHYKQALQVNGKNAAVHEEMAKLYGEWADHAPAEKQQELRGKHFESLIKAANHGPTLTEPRRALLAAAMARDEVPESVHWAKEVIGLEPANAEAHYALAAAALEGQGGARSTENLTPVIPEVKRHIKALEDAKGGEVRLAWLKARLAQISNDSKGRETVLAKARTLRLPKDADPVDRTALLMLRALEVETTTDPVPLADRVGLLQQETHALVADPAIAPNRVMRLNLLLGRVQKTLTRTAAQVDPKSKGGVEALVEAIDKDVDSVFEQALAALSKTDMHVYLAYADHLRFRGKRDRCLEVVDQAMKSPLADQPASAEVMMGLRAVGVEAALADGQDAERFAKAEPHIKALIASSQPRSQGFGHLFEGAIELEQSGVVGTPSKEGNVAASAQPKLRASALNHLKQAAAQLPDVVEAQARYGVALILAQELSLGRQYLQAAMRKGETEPQYQLWAAWSVVQAGYPEEAEPVVDHLLAELAAGRLSRDLSGTLHLLSGEIHQARRSPEDLKKALGEYEQSYQGKVAPAGVALRMAQIEVQLGQGDQALRRIDDLRGRGQGGTAAEHLAVLTLLELGRPKEAREALAKARSTYPASEELIGLEASLFLKDEKPKEADRVLSEFLAKDPGNVGVTLLRAQVLADSLDDAKEARRLLAAVADRSENSAPLVQLALLDLKQRDYPAVSATIEKIRARWKEAAAADLLDAQLALEQGNLADADSHFDAALKKDPGNKMVQFWKAQIDSRLGASTEAAQAFETIVKDGSTKQLDSGLSLAAAARSALANLALQNNDLDGAIRRFEGLRATGGTLGGLARIDRWQLVGAYAAKGQWASARKEIAQLLNDPKAPPTDDERVRAANYYRQNKEDAPAISQLDYVLSIHPAHPGAVVSRAYMLWEAKKASDAGALLRKAIATPSKGAPPAVFFLMLAALEYDSPPAAEASKRAMKVLDQGLAVQPKAVDLVRARAKLLALSNGPKEAVAYVEEQAKDDPTGTIERLLADVYREQQDEPNAEKTLRDLVAKNPRDSGLAVNLVRVVATQAVRAGENNDRDRERTLNDRTATLIKDFRAKFPSDLALLQEDCNLAFRRGDVSRALSITGEIDQVAKNSPVGPLLRARIFGAQGRTRDVADAYTEALRRNPAQPEVRLLLGQTRLKLGEGDEAIHQAHLVLDGNQDRGDAILLEARALGQSAGRRPQAIDLLSTSIKQHPKFIAAYHLLAEMQLAGGQKAEAIATLRSALSATPTDALGLAQLIELLATPAQGAGSDTGQLAEAKTLAESVAAKDTTGNLLLALAVGYHKAGQLVEARVWAEKAAARLDSPIVHLNYGDILLSIAESKREDQAADDFRKAVEQYDLVLRTQANSVEAVNNKAWIMSRYLGESQKALEIAQAFLSRVDPSTLPGEFFDTLGSIQEAVGRPRDAEESYTKGLRKAPDHPVLNYHMGKLILADARRLSKARGYLEVAQAGKSRLSPSMAAEVETLMDRSRTR